MHNRINKLACVFSKIKGDLARLIAAALRKSLKRRGASDDLLPPPAPEGYYYPNPSCETEALLADIMSGTINDIMKGFDDAIDLTSTDGERPQSRLSPKFYSSISLSAVGFGFFYLTSVPYILNSSVLTAIAAISYLMCIEGVLLKSLPGGGNELLESLNDSKGIYKIFPLLSFLLGLWLFIRILIVSPDSEFSNLQQDLLSMGSFSLTFALMLIGYIIAIIIIGFFIKRKASNSS